MRCCVHHGAPLQGGSAASVIAVVTLEHGRPVPCGGAESGQTVKLGWCDFEAKVALPSALLPATLADLYISMQQPRPAGGVGGADARFTLDYFEMRVS